MTGAVVNFHRVAALLCGLVLLHVPAHAAILIHEYALRGSLEDTLGGNPLTPLGGQITALGYVFSENQGFAFSSRSFTPSDYSIEFSFRLDNTTTASKLLDFQNLTTGAGLYQKSGLLGFSPVISASVPDFTAGTDVHVVLTRDAATSLVTAYVNGQQRFSFLDPLSLATAGDTLTFFVGDQLVSSGGSANYLRIFNGALTAGEVSALFAAGPPVLVPEPSTLILMTIGTATLAFAARRRWRR